MCAGPFVNRLLSIEPQVSEAFENYMLHKRELLRPGTVRLSLSYTDSDEDVTYILRAVDFVARHGYKFLSDYTYYADTGRQEGGVLVLEGWTNIYLLPQASFDTHRSASSRCSATGCTPCPTLLASSARRSSNARFVVGFGQNRTSNAHN